MIISRVAIKTIYGKRLTLTEKKAYLVIKRMLEHEEDFSRDHGMADAFRGYFTIKKDK